MGWDLSNAVAFAFEYGGELPSTSRDWLIAHVGEPRGLVKSPFLAARNTAVREAIKLGCEYAIFIDHDVTVTEPGVWRWLETEGDVVACECALPGNAWVTDHAFHTPLWRCRLDVLRAIEPPWFEHIYTDDGCDMLGCECLYFRRKAEALGFHVTHGGWCSHRQDGTWRHG